jgi:hypothetical protein
MERLSGNRQITAKLILKLSNHWILKISEPYFQLEPEGPEDKSNMAAAQVAKKLKDKRQQRTIEGIFKKVRWLKAVASVAWKQLLIQITGRQGWHRKYFSVWILWHILRPRYCGWQGGN